LSLDATLVRVSRELAPSCPDLAEELAITSAELTFLPDRRQAFENLNNRTDMNSIRGVVNTLMQTAKFGTPLAQSLRVLATEYRDARMFRAEEKAARLPALMTVPMILFILPTLFIVLMGPAALGIIDTFNRGGSGNSQPKTVTVVTHKDSGDSSGPAPGQTTIIEKHAEDDPSSAAQKPAAVPAPPATVASGQASAAVGEPITVTVDARALGNDRDLQVVVVPADTPDAVVDPKTFFADGREVAATQMDAVVTARTPGRNEIRLYSIPQIGSSYTVAARSAITITPAAAK
jgi:hypothetical protein